MKGFTMKLSDVDKNGWISVDEKIRVDPRPNILSSQSCESFTALKCNTEYDIVLYSQGFG